jgi:integrase/recombinase XerD
MSTHFRSCWATDFEALLRFKRSLGYRYARSEFTLREFDRFLLRLPAYQRRAECLDQAILAWLASKPHRKAISVSADASVLRQFCLYLRRCPNRSKVPEPHWPRLPRESTFVPYLFSQGDIRRLLQLAAQLTQPVFRAALYRALLLLLYCTGLRFGEALRLRMRDVNTHAGVLFVEIFKGRARWVPFHRSLSRELDKYLAARRAFAPAEPDDLFFIGVNKRTLSVNTASETLRALFRKAGLKPDRGRIGPRPYDLRHVFAVRRLTRWSQQGIDLQARLPWLSAYMGHDDILGTETYLNATPELLGLAAHRFRRRYLSARKQGNKGES